MGLGKTSSNNCALAVGANGAGKRVVIGGNNRGSAPHRRYELIKEISRGGMGTVHLGRLEGPLGFSKRVAIKSLRPDHANNPRVREMFINEARLTARLNHANIASTVDVLVEADAVYIVMEYIEGSSLAELLSGAYSSGRQIPIEVACAIVHDVLVGLDHAHDAQDERLGALGIVHCDVSPQNVRIGIDGLTRILDFGIARARESFFKNNRSSSQLTKLHGKIPYMAPEQINGRPLDRRVDVYAAGVLLWEMLVGKRLFTGDSPVTLVSSVLTQVVAKPSSVSPAVSKELDDLVMKALSRNPRDRFSTAAEMAEWLATSMPLASRAEVADVLYELRPTEHTPVSGIRRLSPNALSLARTTQRRRRLERLTESSGAVVVTAVPPPPPKKEEEPEKPVVVAKRPTTTMGKRSLAVIAAVGLLGLLVGAGHAYLRSAPESTSASTAASPIVAPTTTTTPSVVATHAPAPSALPAAIAPASTTPNNPPKVGGGRVARPSGMKSRR